MKTNETLLAIALAVGMLSTTNAHAVLTLTLNDQGIYDSGRNITWLRDTDLAFTNSFGVAGIGIGGAMDWNTANNWVAAMKAANYLGYNDWRLPTLTDTGLPGCTNYYSYSGTDCGYNVDTATGEIAHLFFDELGNKSQYNASGVLQPLNSYGLLHTDNFLNFGLQSSYWYGTENAANINQAWRFSVYNGYQAVSSKSIQHRVLVVRDGQSVSAVPEPETYAMLLAGLGLLSFTARRRKQSV